jgi:hypothetical protein
MERMAEPQTPQKTYGATRERGATVSYNEIERAARGLMDQGERPTVESVRKALGRGSPNHIAVCMQRFWKDQAALNAGDPVALTRLPPELADAAMAQWEKALLLAQQTAKHDDNAAHAHLEQLRRDNEVRAHSFDLREKEWDLAARVRERALADAREHVNVLMKELAIDRAELRARNARIADLESQLEDYRRQLATLVTRAITRNRALADGKPKRRAPAKPKAKLRRRPALRRAPPRKRAKGRAKR